MPYPLVRLLQSLANDQALTDLCEFDEHTVEWAITCGLGPIFWALVQSSSQHFAAEDSSQRLKAADLTARMLTAEAFEVLGRILACAGAQNCPVTLLKGVSIAQQCYPQRHWRPMRDFDLLVTQQDQPRFEQTLRELGFHQQGSRPASFFAGHHHSMPFYHPHWRCWLEVHTRLFRPDTPAGRIPAFQPAALSQQRIAIDFPQADVARLTDELQLVYTAVHWGAKFTRVGGIVPVFDTVLLLKQAGAQLDWGRVMTICEDQTAARHLTLMLAYLERHGLYRVPSEVWSGLAHGRRSLGRIGLRILLATVDDYMAGGRPFSGFMSEALINTRWDTLLGEGGAWRKLMQLPWRILFPPADTGRYEPVRLLRRARSLWMRL